MLIALLVPLALAITFYAVVLLRSALAKRAVPSAEAGDDGRRALHVLRQLKAALGGRSESEALATATRAGGG